MKAAVIREHGGTEKIEVAELPDPTPGVGEVAVDVKAAALNHLDIWVRTGGRVELDFPHVLGSDAAGVVAAVGEGVDGVAVGDEVVVSPGLHCGTCEFCRRGEQSECVDFGIIGLTRPGVFATRAVVPAANVVAKPAELSFAHAAALPVAYVTAWRMLFTRARVRPGETVLIHGIGGGVAVAALQLARHAGCEAVVTSSSNDKLSLARDLGAARTVNYKLIDDLPGEIIEMTGGRGVDVVIDAVGAATWPVNFAVTRRGGRIVHCGITTGMEVTASIQELYWKQLIVMGSTYGSDEELRLLLRTIVAAGIEPVIDKTFDLADARAATERMENAEQFGKLLLNVG